MDRKYRLIIFDLDGTLIDSLPYHMMAFKDLLKEHGIKVSHSYIRKLMGIPTLDIFRDLKNKYKFDENIQDLREERRYHYFKFLGNRDIIFPGVRNALRKLRRRYKIAVATGSSKIIFTHSTDAKFQKLFDLVVTANDVKKGKPSPDQFLLIAKRMRVKHDKCLIVGDSVYDAEAANRAKMDFLGVTTGYNSERTLYRHGAVGTTRSIADLAKRLAVSRGIPGS
jgi:beta-phosphoglucomutase